MYTIGVFSRISHVSARMLRHYDAIGLLHPAHIDEATCYRFYDEAQLSTLLQIERLKSYGFTLTQVRELLTLTAEEKVRRIRERRAAAYHELEALRGSLSRMEKEIVRMEGTGMNDDQYHVIIMECPAMRVFGVRKTIALEDTHALFQMLYREMAVRGLKRSGPTQLLYLGEEFHEAAMEVEAQAVVAGDAPGVKEFAGGTFAAVTHTGPYDTVQYAYGALCAWVAGHPEYQICGPGVERYLRDEKEVHNPEELETGILFPVKKIGSSTCFEASRRVAKRTVADC